MSESLHHSDLIENVTYDELQVGQSATLRRTLSNADIQAFALVSGDVNPAHVDPAYAEGTRFHGVIVHGMFAGALISTVLGTEFPGPGTIYMSQTLKFERPVRVGDTLTVTLTVRSKDDAHHNVVLDCVVNNQAGEEVVSGEALVKAPKDKVVRPRAALPTMHLFDPEARLQAWIAGLAGGAPVRCAVVHPCDDGSLRGALEAAQHGLIVPVLVGPRARIEAVAAAGGLSLDRDAARAAMATIAEPLGMTVEQAAEAVLAIAMAHMTRGVRKVSVERGLDPRQFTLFPFGGAGPLHAGLLLRHLGLRSVVVPLRPGLFSADGLLAAGIRIE